MKARNGSNWSLRALFTPIAAQPGVAHDVEPKELAGVQTETHVLPRSDMFNDPASMAIILRPSIAATSQVAETWHTHANTESDGHRNVQDAAATMYQGQMPVDAGSNYTFMPGPNTTTDIPAAPQMSVLRQQFEAALERVQNHLMGAP